MVIIRKKDNKKGNDFFMKFNYIKRDFGKFDVIGDDDDEHFCFGVYSEIHAITLSELLNDLYGQISYQSRVIDKCIKNEKLYKNIINDQDESISVLNKEKRILKKIIHEKDGESISFLRLKIFHDQMCKVLLMNIKNIG